MEESVPEVLKREIMDPIGASSSWNWYGYEKSKILDHTEQKIKKETKATIRCIDDTFSDEGICIISGKKSKQLVYFAKAY